MDAPVTKFTALQETLKNTVENDPFSISAEVAREALDYENPVLFFNDLLNYGCRTGMVKSMIYYRDTWAFFDTHYQEIEGLREEWEDLNGIPVQIYGDLKDSLARFAFEETAYQLAYELGLEL